SSAPMQYIVSLSSADLGSGLQMFAASFSNSFIYARDASTWSAVSGALAYQWAVCGHDDGTGSRLYVARGTAADSIRSWDGTNWSAVGPPNTAPDGTAKAFLSGGPGGPLYVTGAIQNVGGAPSPSVGRWEGGQWHAMPGLSGQGYSLGFHNNGS